MKLGDVQWHANALGAAEVSLLGPKSDTLNIANDLISQNYGPWVLIGDFCLSKIFVKEYLTTVKSSYYAVGPSPAFKICYMQVCYTSTLDGDDDFSIEGGKSKTLPSGYGYVLIKGRL